MWETHLIILDVILEAITILRLNICEKGWKILERLGERKPKNGSSPLFCQFLWQIVQKTISDKFLSRGWQTEERLRSQNKTKIKTDRKGTFSFCEKERERECVSVCVCVSKIKRNWDRERERRKNKKNPILNIRHKLGKLICLPVIQNSHWQCFDECVLSWINLKPTNFLIFWKNPSVSSLCTDIAHKNSLSFQRNF